MDEEIDRRLLAIIKEQQSPKLKMVDPQDPRCTRLLDTLRQGTTQPIDVFYVLNGAREAKHLYVDEVLGTHTAVYFEPHIFDYENEELSAHAGHSLEEVISVNRKKLNLNNVALIVDNSWESGETTRKAVAYLEEVGYERKKIFVFHYFGCFGWGQLIESKRFGFVSHNPVLLRAQSMLDFFDHPEKYQ